MTANTVLKTIHVGARQLGLDNDGRRELQLLVTGKESLSTMTAAEQLAVLEAMKERGFKPSSGKASRTHRRPATRGDIRFAHVLWGKLVRAGAVNLPGAAGLNAFIRSQYEQAWGAVPFDIDGLRDWKQIATVIEALKSMCLRAGITL